MNVRWIVVAMNDERDHEIVVEHAMAEAKLCRAPVLTVGQGFAAITAPLFAVVSRLGVLVTQPRHRLVGGSFDVGFSQREQFVRQIGQTRGCPGSRRSCDGGPPLETCRVVGVGRPPKTHQQQGDRREEE
jgi:hypothetical protein